MPYEERGLTQWNILIVEDDKEVAKLISDLFENNEWVTKSTGRLKLAKRFLEKMHFDLICLDLILPDGNGYELLKELQNKYHLHDTKVVVISKRKSAKDIVEGLEKGVDEYIPKPFTPKELNLRIRKLLEEKKKHVYESKNGVLQLDKRTMQVQYDDHKIFLTKTEFLTFEYIFSSEGFVRTESLIKFLEAKTAKKVDNTALTTTIKRLRDKLQRKTGKRFVKNKYGLGYYIS